MSANEEAKIECPDDSIVELTFDHLQLRNEILKLSRTKPELFRLQFVSLQRIEFGYLLDLNIWCFDIKHQMTMVIPFDYPFQAPWAFLQTKEHQIDDKVDDRVMHPIPHRLGRPLCLNVESKWKPTMRLIDVVQRAFNALSSVPEQK